MSVFVHVSSQFHKPRRREVDPVNISALRLGCGWGLCGDPRTLGQQDPLQTRASIAGLFIAGVAFGIPCVPKNQQSRAASGHYFWFRDQCFRASIYFNPKKFYKHWIRLYKRFLDLLLWNVATHLEKKPFLSVLVAPSLKEVAWCQPVFLKQLKSL